MPFDLRVGHVYGRLPSCIVSWFRFDPQQRCLVLGRCTWRAWFSSWKMAIGVPKTPFSPRCAGELQRPLFITPHACPKSRVTPVGRSTGTLYPIEKNVF